MMRFIPMLEAVLDVPNVEPSSLDLQVLEAVHCTLQVRMRTKISVKRFNLHFRFLTSLSSAMYIDQPGF